ncbi:MAG: YbhB/YbcL family Raf kinase inhibitor-like protein [Myxococcales bacterium]|nr:YbhB/YbcL family Raf kinase inhibitor-like protein [Myxococcales bacterium]
MKLGSRSFTANGRIPAEFAAGVRGEPGPVPGENQSPHVAWSEFPNGTKSFALICHDPDAPSKADDVNKTDRKVPYDLPRIDFYHWVLVDIPVSVTSLEEGAESDAFVPKGKPLGQFPHGRRGKNSFGDWFGDDAAMGGTYGGYDGPWPPFNDERLHHYVFTIYALDVPTLDLPEVFGGAEVLSAIKGHVLDSATWAGTYTLNKEARA